MVSNRKEEGSSRNHSQSDRQATTTLMQANYSARTVRLKKFNRLFNQDEGGATVTLD